MANALEELADFLKDSRSLVRAHAVDTVAGLTASADGLEYIRAYPRLADELLARLSDADPGIARDAFKAVVNMTGDRTLAQRTIDVPGLFAHLVATTTEPTSLFADLAAMVLSNLTRNELGCGKLLGTNTPEEGQALYKLVDVFCKGAFNHNPNASLNFLAPILENVSQSNLGRRLLVDQERAVLPRLLTHLENPDRVRRGGVAGIARNCCFETAAHEYLLGEKVDILSFLLLPLCGPEEFDDEDMDGMPDCCQYLDSSKQREPEVSIRRHLVEALYQLCATKHGRTVLRAKKVYPIIREMHKHETDSDLDKACDHLVQVLVGEESGHEDLKQVPLPESYTSKLAEQVRPTTSIEDDNDDDAIMVDDPSLF
ncbi:hypothetical protein CAOG_05904 [Capsaspora owczarzaki ATCC 30864]|uniref:Protein HGH1 homolog n=1 Tax=Capsaspora owczarzaki (strain ATCC 30864) TaxID=595528 RepID=A0A0D2WSZ4_CAPO3|nr:hypothetical protein CAOG_05904 [Capsaspora owczarzaki ATCC 30864]KJE95455.1 hypothetical protein CAOG_005904 [Capsaspora owczarzaki ATCC 30864]|eukprot:XP_004345494.1 hypothetical protein CAOG_05904 [Capsaspora owczarzaki ATCC 30864]